MSNKTISKKVSYKTPFLNLHFKYRNKFPELPFKKEFDYKQNSNKKQKSD